MTTPPFFLVYRVEFFASGYGFTHLGLYTKLKDALHRAEQYIEFTGLPLAVVPRTLGAHVRYEPTRDVDYCRVDIHYEVYR